LDAGSSHTQLFVYQWEAGKVNGTAVAQQIHTCKAQGRSHDPTDSPHTTLLECYTLTWSG